MLLLCTDWFAMGEKVSAEIARHFIAFCCCVEVINVHCSKNQVLSKSSVTNKKYRQASNRVG